MTRRKRSIPALAMLIACGLVVMASNGCAGDGSGLVDDMFDPPDMEPDVPTLDELQAQIFGVRCTECHVPGGPGPMPLDSADVTFQSLVGVPSVEIGSLFRVEPGNAENSYLVHKVEGRPSILGQRMPPPPRPPLSSEEIAMIRDWIDAGANR